MADERSIRRYRRWYARLLRVYPRPYRERFGEGMEQTFNDRLRERAAEGGGVFGTALRMFLDTSAAIVRAHMKDPKNRNIIRIAVATGILLLVPLVAMLFTDEVNWGPADLALAGVLLFGAGLTYELVAKRADDLAYRAAVFGAVGTTVLLIWINLSVGIIGDEANPANLMYAAVIAVGLVGAALARFRPRGMAWALLLTGLAQIAVAVAARIAGSGLTFILDGIFALLWLGSAFLFRRAATAGSRGTGASPPP